MPFSVHLSFICWHEEFFGKIAGCFSTPLPFWMIQCDNLFLQEVLQTKNPQTWFFKHFIVPPHKYSIVYNPHVYIQGQISPPNWHRLQLRILFGLQDRGMNLVRISMNSVSLSICFVSDSWSIWSVNKESVLLNCCHVLYFDGVESKWKMLGSIWKFHVPRTSGCKMKPFFIFLL